MGAVLGVLAISAFTACSDNDDDNNNVAQGAARMKVHMTDAPGDYDAVYVDVTDVKIKATADASEEGWVSLNGIQPGVYNLLDLTGGVTVMLADAQIAAGYVSQIRIILGENNTVVKNGVTYQLNTPSAQQSGLKINVNQTLAAGSVNEFLIDFDVESSVVQAGGSGNFNLHPVLRLSSLNETGAIKGKVNLTLGLPVLVSATANGVAVNTYTNAQGEFYLHGIPAGNNYTVTLTPALASGLSVTLVQNVAVTAGAATNLGLVTLAD